MKPPSTLTFNISERKMTNPRTKSVLLRSEAEIRLMQSIDGPSTGSRTLFIRTPSGLSIELALDRGGDIHRLSYQAKELGWHSAVDGVGFWPAQDSEEGLGFLRGFDGFLVTCGLDSHGVPNQTDASHFLYPLRQKNHHPLHGRIMAQKAELVLKEIDWNNDCINVRLVTRQATVFGEVLELARHYKIGLSRPTIIIKDTVYNRGFQPTRHGILYHFNIGYPLLDKGTRLIGTKWKFKNALDNGGAVPSDGHVEIVDVGSSPIDGIIGVTNPEIGVTLSLSFNKNILPNTALWQAFQSGTFALGLEPQTSFSDPNCEIMPQERRLYSVKIDISS